jgi:hypothetical protein
MQIFHRAPVSLLMLPVVLTLGSCASTPNLPPGELVGAEIQEREIVSLATVESNPSAYREQTLLVEATAIAVCLKKGCWMQVEDQGRRAMVRWEAGCGGQYAFPGDVVGRRVLIQGSFYRTSISEEDASHIEEEGGAGVRIDRATSEMNASAVLVLDGGLRGR